MKNKKGFYLSGKKYYYSAETNTLLNGELAEHFEKFSDAMEVQVEDFRIDTDSLRKGLQRIKQIIFESTQKCNLKCAYCTYESGEYFYSRQSGGSKSISFDTAKNSLLQLWKIIKDRDNRDLTIGFYGGEPLLNFETIKRIVSYAKELFRDWSIKYAMTTNATLLNRQIIGYIIKNNFLTYVSIDGPQTNHDSKRLQANGKGSFRKVMENLELIRNTNEEYYRERVYFSAVFSKDLPIADVVDFFNNDQLVKNNQARLGYVTSTDSTYYDRYPYDAEQLNRAIEMVFESIKEKKREGKELSSIEEALCGPDHFLLESLLNKKFNTLMGTCFFDSRLYVDADGGFHICEKMNSHFQFGNAFDGFNYDKMAEIATQYIELLENNCRGCEFRFLCNKCYIHFAKDGTFQVTEEYCRKEKQAIKKMMEKAISFQEK